MTAAGAPGAEARTDEAGQEQGPAGDDTTVAATADGAGAGPAVGDGEPAAAGAAPFVPSFKVMDVADVALELPAQYPNVTLQESEWPLRQLVMPVGLTEGTWMAYALRKLSTPRPLTHELFAEVLRRYRLDVVAVRIVGRKAGTYLAELDLMGSEGREVVPCRPTDGITLALRMPVPAPILCDERLLDDGTDDVEPGAVPTPTRGARRAPEEDRLPEG